jgi:hypothetical protein
MKCEKTIKYGIIALPLSPSPFKNTHYPELTVREFRKTTSHVPQPFKRLYLRHDWLSARPFLARWLNRHSARVRMMKRCRIFELAGLHARGAANVLTVLGGH